MQMLNQRSLHTARKLAAGEPQRWIHEEMKSSTRWVLTPLAIIAAFIAAMLLAVPLNYTIHTLLWSTGHYMPGRNFLMVAMTYDGALAAFLVVLAGALAAPRKRLLTAVIVFIVGAALAWAEIGEMYSPTGPARVWSPIIGTYIGGLLGILLIAIRERKKIQPSARGDGIPPPQP